MRELFIEEKVRNRRYRAVNFRVRVVRMFHNIVNTPLYLFSYHFVLQRKQCYIMILVSANFRGANIKAEVEKLDYIIMTINGIRYTKLVR